MSLTVGSRLGPYEIVAPLGAGGMGEVYRAHDTKLNRDVAIKVLPDDVAADPDRLARFEREAQVLAALNHPNIATVHAVEDRAIVMELVGGEDLSTRLQRGPIPLTEALPLARQIADALSAAHEAGIIHRDLKPANIKVRDDGTVKVLDFGLAKAFDSGATPGTSEAANSPTLTNRATQMGVILGTAAYMAPEQARGKVVDKRADIWAFGVVLYEMLTGTRPFVGDDVTDVLAAVVRAEPDWSALPAATPLLVRRLLRRCLTKDVKQRLRDIADARVDIEEESGAPANDASNMGSSPSQALGRRTALRFVPWILAVAATVAAATVLFRDDSAPVEVRFTVDLPAGYRLAEGTPTVSPDGRRVVFVALNGGTSHLMIRDLSEPAAEVIPGTEGADAGPCPPFFSPDGRWVAFVAGRKIRKVEVTAPGGSVLDVADFGGTEALHGGAWSEDGWILVGGGIARGLLRVREEGGTLDPIAEPKRSQGEISYQRPSFLPGGRVLVSIQSATGYSIGALALGGQEAPQILLPQATSARYLAPDRLLFSNPDKLFIQRFDARNMQLLDSPVLLADHLPGTDWGGGIYPHYAASAAGTLATLTQRPEESRSVARWTKRLVLLDRNGRMTVIAEDAGDTVRFAPAGDALLTYEWVQITTHDLKREGLRRVLTSGPPRVLPIYTPDGSRIVYTSYQSGAGDLYSMSAQDGSDQRLLLGSERRKYPESVSRNGVLTYREYDPDTRDDIWAVPLDGKGAPTPVIRTKASESGSSFSPDGRLIAYSSDREGRTEVYVQPYPDGKSQRVSVDGGGAPRWHPNGGEVFYLDDRRIMAATVSNTDGHPKVGTPRRVLDAAVLAFDVSISPDGLRFAALMPAENPPERFLSILTNWRPRAKQSQ